MDAIKSKMHKLSGETAEATSKADRCFLLPIKSQSFLNVLVEKGRCAAKKKTRQASVFILTVKSFISLF